MLKMNFIEPAQTKWASTFVFIPKKDGHRIFCFHYIMINDVTVRDSYPLPRMDSLNYSFGDSEVFTTLDENLD